MNEINRENLLNCDEDDDENERLKEFYERNLQFLKKYPDSTKLADIARMIHKTLLGGNVYWREYAEILGITDGDELDKVEVSAEKYREQELFTLFTRVLPKTKGFDHIIRMLIIKKRFDVLHKIRPNAEELIEKSQRNTHVKEVFVIEPQYNSESLTNSNACCIQELNSETSFSNSDSYCKSNIYTCIQNSALEIKKEFDGLQQCSMSDSCKIQTITPDSTVIFENLFEENLPPETCIPSAPMLENLTKIYVFILHTKADTDYARQLSEKLRNAGFKVKTMSDMEVVLAMNDIEALRTIFEEVDFIVPVVSDSLFQVIHTPRLNQLVESTDAVNNKIFYQWIMNEYQCNSCINYRVRPVIVPGMNRQKLIKDLIFKFSLRLGVEDDKLIRILRETKALIPEYRV